MCARCVAGAVVGLIYRHISPTVLPIDGAVSEYAMVRGAAMWALGGYVVHVLAVMLMIKRWCYRPCTTFSKMGMTIAN